MQVAQLRKLLPGALSLLVVTSAANAGTDTAVLTVTATVLSSCTIEGGTLDFGQYVTGQVSDLDGVGEIVLTNCEGQVTIAMDGGNAGSVSARQMSNAGNTLNYQLYRDPSRSQVWGEGGRPLSDRSWPARPRFRYSGGFRAASPSRPGHTPTLSTSP